uniref:Olfactory receptor n=1 Tax=Sus scrofa TaxID=9823 RepID=I3L9D7_PIG
MDAGNLSVVSEFVLLGLCQSWTMQVLLLLVFFILFLIIVSGNITIMILITIDTHLHSPMYFLLANLFFVDMWLCSITTPKMITDFVREKKTISFGGCMCQVLFVHFFGGGEMVLLVVMAYDRYVAICKPLHYLTIMNVQKCIGLVAISWTIGFVHAISQMAVIIQLPFCGPREIDSFFCDIPLVIKLACIDSHSLGILMNADSGVPAMTCFIVFITWVDKFLAVFYSVFTPLLNPAIYTLRNKEIKNALKRFRSYYLHSKEKFTA